MRATSVLARTAGSDPSCSSARSIQVSTVSRVGGFAQVGVAPAVGELGVELGACGRVGAELDHVLDRFAEAVHPERLLARARHSPPQLRARVLVGLKRRGLPEQRRGVVHLVALARLLGGTPRPAQGARAQLGQRPGVVAPRAFGRHGLGVVVREQRRVPVGAGVAALEPFGEARVQARAPGGRQRPVGDLAGQFVLEEVLAFGFERGAAAPADEVAFFELSEVRRRRTHQLADGALPERPSDDGRSLQRALLQRR